MTKPYLKPHLSVTEQIALLQTRGMKISDQSKATQYLDRLGYYRLSGYWYPLREVMLSADSSRGWEVQDHFRKGTEFSHAVDLYVFDKRLRLLFMDALERIEVGLRVQIALLLGARDRQAHRLAAQLHPRFSKRSSIGEASPHETWLGRLDKLTADSREEYVAHFRGKYSDPLPIWVAIELWDFGLLSKFVSGMKVPDLEYLARLYSIPDWQLFVSWVRALNHVRNICAHHSRLWNRPPTDRPKMPKVGQISMLDHLVTDDFARSRIYATAALTQFFLCSISPSSSWHQRLAEHFKTFPVGAPGCAIGQTGFPAGWEALPLWK